MANPIKDSLLYKTLFTPEMDFTGANVAGSEGEQRLQTLTQRIKKMEQSDRKELQADLNRILTAGNKLNLKLLKERGVCVLLLTNFGTHTQSHNIIDSFFRWIRNTFGDRVSSQSLVNTIRAIQAADQANPRQALDPEVVRQTLATCQADRRADQNPEAAQQKLTALNALKVLCDDDCATASEKIKEIKNCHVGLAEHINLANAAAKVATRLAHSGVPDDLLVAIQRTADYKNKTALQILNELGGVDNAYLTSYEKDVAEKLLDFAKKSPANEKAIYSDVVKLAYCVYSTKLETLNKCLSSAYEEEQSNANQLQSEIDLLGKRSNLLVAGRHLLVLDASILNTNRALRAEEKKIHELNATIRLINGWLRELGKLDSEDPSNSADRSLMLKAQIREYLDEQKNPVPNTLTKHLQFLFAVLCGDVAGFPRGGLPKLDKYLESFGSDDAQLQQNKARLRQVYQMDPMTLVDAESKQAYVENYLACLKIFLSSEAALCDERKEKCVSEIRELQAKRREVKQLDQANIPFAVEDAPVPIHPVVANPAVSGLTAQLFNYADQLGASDMRLQEACNLLQERTEVRNRVYQNFYFIMKREGRIREEDNNWGGLVFSGKELNRLLKNTTNNDLRKCRARALQLAARGHTIVTENDPIFLS